MELEASAWTRRDRLERIADAERDRRAGRVEVALASLGEAIEWPARLVLALAKLSEDEGADAREILEATLDDWAAEIGLDPLEPSIAVADDEAGVAREAVADVEEDAARDAVDVAEPDLVVDADDALEEDLLAPPRESAPDTLEAPIEVDELERAFAEAEAQTDEMHDVNDIAGRVLDAEPVGLAELTGSAYDAIDDDLGAFAAEDAAAAPETDAAWAAAPIWPEPIAAEDAFVGADAGPNGHDDLDSDAPGDAPSRSMVLTTLERWLENIRAGRAQ